MFDPKSRYKDLEVYDVKDRRGRTVKVVSVSQVPAQTLLGVHRLRQGQRLDHLSTKYLDDPAGFWRICEINDVMLPESLSEKLEIEIPVKER